MADLGVRRCEIDTLFLVCLQKSPWSGTPEERKTVKKKMTSLELIIVSLFSYLEIFFEAIRLTKKISMFEINISACHL
jgi:hypothetical protein